MFDTLDDVPNPSRDVLDANTEAAARDLIVAADRKLADSFEQRQ